MAVSSLKRIQKEFADIKKSPTPGCSAGPKDAKNMHDWEGYIEGPVDTPFAGGKFKMTI